MTSKNSTRVAKVVNVKLPTRVTMKMGFQWDSKMSKSPKIFSSHYFAHNFKNISQEERHQTTFLPNISYTNITYVKQITQLYIIDHVE